MLFVIVVFADPLGNSEVRGRRTLSKIVRRSAHHQSPEHDRYDHCNKNPWQHAPQRPRHVQGVLNHPSQRPLRSCLSSRTISCNSALPLSTNTFDFASDVGENGSGFYLTDLKEHCCPREDTSPRF